TRKKGNLENKEEVLLNLNQMAKGHTYFNVAARVVSPDNSLLAYAEDTMGRRQYTIYIKDLTSGNVLSDKITNTSGTMVWGNDNKTLFYVINDDALRLYKIYRHTLGSPSSQDVLVYHEKDETYSTHIYKTKSEKYLVIANNTTIAN